MSRRQEERQEQGAYDPLRLCVLTTVALLAWLLGPAVVGGLALLGFLGYLRARREGLTTSRCILRATRLVLVYLALVAGMGVVGVASQLSDLIG